VLTIKVANMFVFVKWMDVLEFLVSDSIYAYIQCE